MCFFVHENFQKRERESKVMYEEDSATGNSTPGPGNGSSSTLTTHSGTPTNEWCSKVDQHQL